jgi:hypothetical protein
MSSRVNDGQPTVGGAAAGGLRKVLTAPRIWTESVGQGVD